MELNPYARYLDGQDARAVLAATPGLLHQSACALTPEQVEAPIAPGKWSPRQIVAHIADCELAFSFRLRQTLAEPHYVAQPFDQALRRLHTARGARAFSRRTRVEPEADRRPERSRLRKTVHPS